MAFKPGDIVRLKSSSPPMTVAWSEENMGAHQTYVSWFDGKTKCEATFYTAQLELVP